MIDLGRAIRMGRGEIQAGGQDKDALLCDTFEALVGAIYLSAGIEAAQAFHGSLLPTGGRYVRSPRILWMTRKACSSNGLRRVDLRPHNMRPAMCPGLIMPGSSKWMYWWTVRFMVRASGARNKWPPNWQLRMRWIILNISMNNGKQS